VKRLSYCALILVLLSVPAFAAKNSKSVNFPEAVTVGSTQLPAGDYNVIWNGTGSNVQVTLVQKSVSHPATATVTAKVMEEKHDRDGYMVDSKGGRNTLESLTFNKVSVVLSSSPAPGQ
jgi:hypothetical protein